MDKQTTLLGLDEDILYLILKQIQIDSPASLLQFASASKKCEKLAGSILYRSITLSDKGNKKELSRMKRTLERLLNKDDSILDCVIDLRIAEWGLEIDHNRPGISWEIVQANPEVLNAPWDSSKIRNGESNLLSSSQLECVLENLRMLESFSWDAKSMIPERVISKLEKSRPTVKLFVTNNRRTEKTSDRAMDTLLLSSPLLYSLNYSILQGATSSGIVCSEFRRLKDILLQSPKLEVLSLAVYNSTGNDFPVPQASLDWHPLLPIGSPEVEPLTKLDTLTIPSRFSYSGEAISRIYSSIIAQSNDFTNLRQLNLLNLGGNYSFELLKGRVPNVKHLEFVFKIESQNRRSYGQQFCKNATHVRDLLDSINALETLHITSEEENFDILWPAILKHRSSLRRFSIHTLPDQSYRRTCPPVLTVDQMEKLQQSEISNLAMDVLIPDIAWYSKLDHGLNDVDLDPSTALALASFTHVEKLKVFVELPTTESIFSIKYNYNPVGGGDPVPLPKEKPAKDVAVGLFQQIFITDPKASLRELEVCFCRLDIGDRMDSYIVQKSIWVRKVDIDYINNPKAPGYEVEIQQKWSYFS